MPPACFLNAPTLGNPPVFSKGEVLTCAGAQFYCLVQPKSILLPGRDCVRGGENCLRFTTAAAPAKRVRGR